MQFKGEGINNVGYAYLNRNEEKHGFNVTFLNGNMKEIASLLIQLLGSIGLPVENSAGSFVITRCHGSSKRSVTRLEEKINEEQTHIRKYKRNERDRKKERQTTDRKT